MLAVVAMGCGVVLGLAGAELAAPFYWRLITACRLAPGPLARLFWRIQRTLLRHAGHHPYVVGCFEALEHAADPAAVTAALARLRWWSAVRRRP
jgi:hypothetical protein